MLCELSVRGRRVRLLRAVPLRDRHGRALSGLPTPGDEGEREPAYDREGRPLGRDPAGADTEAVVALADGTFWIADEYGPSLLRVDRDGRVLHRLVPQGVATAYRKARYPVREVLPRIALRRRLNRGFEALALSPDGGSLFVLFQSALAHPDRAASERATFARIWELDADTGRFRAQYLYPFDDPRSFVRDRRAGEARAADLKLCDAIAVGARELLVLERISRSAKIYRVRLPATMATPPRHLQLRTRPTLEQMSHDELAAAGIEWPRKELVFSTDQAREVDRDLEGMALLSSRSLLLVNDNDFGVDGAPTRFWRVRFPRSLLARAADQ
jgi:hypothetical protein